MSVLLTKTLGVVFYRGKAYVACAVGDLGNARRCRESPLVRVAACLFAEREAVTSQLSRNRSGLSS